jgi:hypothetical protein
MFVLLQALDGGLEQGVSRTSGEADMSGKIEISREQLERWAYDMRLVSPIGPELRAILAAPVVERQEPVAVVLPERMAIPKPKSNLSDMDMFDYEVGFNACIDKVKELNQ